MTADHPRQLPVLPAIGFGLGRTCGGYVNEARSAECLDYALEQGVRYFDTADCYANGKAEQLLGAALSRNPRSGVLVSTKVGYGPRAHELLPHLHPANLLASVAGSLARLKLEAVPLLLIHRRRLRVELEVLLKGLAQLFQRQWIEHWGVCDWTPEQLRQALSAIDDLGLPLPVACLRESHVYCTRIELEEAREIARMEVPVIGYAPLAGGLAAGHHSQEIPGQRRWAHPEHCKHLIRLRERNQPDFGNRWSALADSHGVSPIQTALAWARRRACVNTVLFGASSPAQLGVTLKILRAPSHGQLQLYQHVSRFLESLR